MDGIKTRAVPRLLREALVGFVPGRVQFSTSVKR
jgi:hypothetical protein